MEDSLSSLEVHSIIIPYERIMFITFDFPSTKILEQPGLILPHFVAGTWNFAAEPL